MLAQFTLKQLTKTTTLKMVFNQGRRFILLLRGKQNLLVVAKGDAAIAAVGVAIRCGEGAKGWR